MDLPFFLVASLIVSVLAFFFAGWLYAYVNKQPSSNKKIAEVSILIRQGANTFLRKEYIVLARFAAVVAILILIFLPSPIWKNEISEKIRVEKKERADSKRAKKIREKKKLTVSYGGRRSSETSFAISNGGNIDIIKDVNIS